MPAGATLMALPDGATRAPCALCGYPFPVASMVARDQGYVCSRCAKIEAPPREETLTSGAWTVTVHGGLTGPERFWLERRFAKAKTREEAQKAMATVRPSNTPWVSAAVEAKL